MHQQRPLNDIIVKEYLALFVDDRFDELLKERKIERDLNKKNFLNKRVTPVARTVLNAKNDFEHEV